MCPESQDVDRIVASVAWEVCSQQHQPESCVLENLISLFQQAHTCVTCVLADGHRQQMFGCGDNYEDRSKIRDTEGKNMECANAWTYAAAVTDGMSHLRLEKWEIIRSSLGLEM